MHSFSTISTLTGSILFKKLVSLFSAFLIVHINLKQISIMETIIYKIELTNNEAVIFTMKTNGTILSSKDVTPSYARCFANINGLACMEDNGEVRCYW